MFSALVLMALFDSIANHSSHELFEIEPADAVVAAALIAIADDESAHG